MIDNVDYLKSYYKNLEVSVCQGDAFYSSSPPFHPSANFPEYDLDSISCEPNPAYDGVRNCLRLLNLDKDRFGSSKWNPLQGIVTPGNRVVIKPNFVVHRHDGGGNLFSIITHPSVIRALVDYVYKALRNEGQIIIADAPQMDCDFQELLRITQLDSIREFYWNARRFNIEIIDLRNFWYDHHLEDNAAYSKHRITLKGDPLGSVLVNLGKKSAFYGIKNTNFYGSDYDRQVTQTHHQNETQEYMISSTVLSADTLITIPKLKVHKKVGVTLTSKGWVGICTDKNYLVHYTLGSPDERGDQFPNNFLTTKEKILLKGQRLLYDLFLSHHNRVLDKLYDFAVYLFPVLIQPWLGNVDIKKQIIDGGNWYGNNSAWRMAVDLARISLFADKKGLICDLPQRKIFSVVDGIIAGENNGPLLPDVKEAGIIVAGFNPLAVDIVCTKLMGFDWMKFKWIQYLLNEDHYIHGVDEICILSDKAEFSSALSSRNKLLNFMPHPGWQGFIET
jgi:uncharacterized protein (DUF362 family)